MTDAERVQLLDIERRLTIESPELHRLLAGVHLEHERRVRRSRRRWWTAGAGTAAVTVALLVTGLVLGVPAVTGAAVCPPVWFLAALVLRRMPAGPARRRVRRRPRRS